MVVNSTKEYRPFVWDIETCDVPLQTVLVDHIVKTQFVDLDITFMYQYVINLAKIIPEII